jgi:hypothetical protein
MVVDVCCSAAAQSISCGHMLIGLERTDSETFSFRKPVPILQPMSACYYSGIPHQTTRRFAPSSSHHDYLTDICTKFSPHETHQSPSTLSSSSNPRTPHAVTLLDQLHALHLQPDKRLHIRACSLSHGYL